MNLRKSDSHNSESVRYFRQRQLISINHVEDLGRFMKGFDVFG